MGTARVPVTFFENFQIESRRLEFEYEKYEKPWFLLSEGRASKSFLFDGLGPSGGGVSEKVLVATAAPAAAAIFREPRTTANMRTRWAQLGSFFNLFPPVSSGVTVS